jgi:hypothetical protein
MQEKPDPGAAVSEGVGESALDFGGGRTEIHEVKRYVGDGFESLVSERTLQETLPRGAI